MANSELFKQILTDFFSLYHPRQVKKVDKMVEEFEGEELKVVHILSKKYKVSLAKFVGWEGLQPPKPEPVVEEPAAEELPVAEETIEETNEEVEATEEVNEEAVASDEISEEEEEFTSAEEEEEEK